MTRGYQLLFALIVYFSCECYSIFFLFILDFIVLSAFEDWLVILQKKTLKTPFCMYLIFLNEVLPVGRINLS